MVTINPGVGVYGMFPSFDYKPWLAIAELLDNSITSYLQNREELEELHGSEFKLVLEVRYDSGRKQLVIADNAGGIPGERFADAFALAKAPDDLRYISRYGVGMKASACWFARDWTLRTSALGEPVERSVDWSTSKITENEITELPEKVRKVSSNEHYTVITLKNLHHPVSAPKTSTKIGSFLPHIFREFIRKYGIEIYWNGKLLGVEEPDVLEAPPEWSKDSPPRIWCEDVRLEMDDGRTIVGRAFLLRKMKRAYTALNMFWHQRLILGNIEPNHRPSELFGAGNSFETGRLCVELHLDGYEPTVDKKGFKFQDDEASLEEIIDALKEAVPELIRQAREYREPKVDPTDGDIPDIGSIIEGPGSETVVDPASPTPTNPYPTPPTLTPAPPLMPGESQPQSGVPSPVSSVEIVVEDLVLKVVVQLESGPGANRFVELFETKPDSSGGQWTLYINIGTQHPFVVRFWNDDQEVRRMLMLMASAIGFGEIAARRAGAKMPSHVRNNIDDFLRRVADGYHRH